MEIPKLVIAPKRYTEETTIVSMRLPKDMLRELDALAKRTGRTRNELMTVGLEFALDHIEIKDRKGK